MEEHQGIDHEYTDEVVCPYCGYVFGDSWEFIRGGRNDGKADCDGCGKTFGWSADFDVTYSTTKTEESK
jgi:transposase